MINKKMKIMVRNSKAEMSTYVVENSEQIQPNRKRPAIIICPGGGYEFVSEKESEPIAIKMLSYGFQAFVLKYSVKPAIYPQALLELASAVKRVREHSEEWNVDIQKIVIMGFSAGGHLAASLGVFWNQKWLEKELLGKSLDWQPNALMLAYPVITSGTFSHEVSFKALLGENFSRRSELSLEGKVSSETPPTFLWHTVEDEVVPVENSFLFAQALRKENVPFSLHIFPKGTHGLSMASIETDPPESDNLREDVAAWPDLFNQWIKTIFF